VLLLDFLAETPKIFEPPGSRNAIFFGKSQRIARRRDSHLSKRW